MNHKLLKLAREDEEALLEYNGSMEEYINHVEIPIIYKYKNDFKKWITEANLEYEEAGAVNCALVEESEDCFIYDILRDGYAYANNLLLCALYESNLGAVTAIRDAGYDLNPILDDDDIDILFQVNCLEIIKFFFANGYKITDERHNIILYYALESEEVLRLVIENGGDVNYTDRDGYTVLHHNAITDSMKLLLKYGADPFVKDRHGKYPHEYLMVHDDDDIELEKLLTEIYEKRNGKRVKLLTQ